MVNAVWLDSRVGSKELLAPLRKLGIPAQLTILDSADVAFTGNGWDGPVEVGIERKTIMDLVQSLRSGRLQGTSHDQHSQLDRLHKTYDIAWLLVEGDMGGDRRFGKLMKAGGGATQRLPGGYTEDSLTKALLSLELRGGMRIKQTATLHQSAIFIGSLFHWFTDKLWDDHSTLHAPLKRESILPLSMFRDIVMRFPGVGIAVSAAVEKRCMVETPTGPHPSLTKLLSMNLSDWEALEEITKTGTRRFGTTKAGRVLEAVRKLR